MTLQPGTVVRLRDNPFGLRNRLGVVMSHSDLTDAVILETEIGPGLGVMRHEVSVVRNPPSTPLRKLRQRLPYGIWTCADGGEVLFNRDYKPIWRRMPGQSPDVADPDEWVDFVSERRFFGDENPPWESAEVDRLCNRVLMLWGLPAV